MSKKKMNILIITHFILKHYSSQFKKINHIQKKFYNMKRVLNQDTKVYKIRITNFSLDIPKIVKITIVLFNLNSKNR